MKGQYLNINANKVFIVKQKTGRDFEDVRKHIISQMDNGEYLFEGNIFLSTENLTKNETRFHPAVSIGTIIAEQEYTDFSIFVKLTAIARESRDSFGINLDWVFGYDINNSINIEYNDIKKHIIESGVKDADPVTALACGWVVRTSATMSEFLESIYSELSTVLIKKSK